MTTLKGPEITDALADCQPGEEVTLMVKGTCVSGGISVESVEKAADDEGQGPEPANESSESDMSGMPSGIAKLTSSAQ